MSNERVVKAAEAVDDLRAALDRWCARAEHEPNALDVHTAGQDAVAAIDQALEALHSIRNDTVSEIRRFHDAQDARVDALLGKMTPTPKEGRDLADYRCGDCGQVFPIDPTDPMVAHGNYLDHMDEHERADLVAEPFDPAELDVPANPTRPLAFESPEVPR